MKATLGLCIAAAFLLALPAAAQVHVQAGGTTVNVGGDDRDDDVNVRAKNITAISTDGGEASVNVGGIGSDVQIQGVAVINGRVYIDGKEIPPNVTRYKSPRTGEVYLIQRKGGSVQVTSEPEKKK